MASSLAKECLSPALRSSSARRRSLDICQQLGGNLLSPNVLCQASQQSPTSSASPSKSSVHSGSSPFKLSDDQSSPIPSTAQVPLSFAQIDESNGYHGRRRASDSFWELEKIKQQLAVVQQSHQDKRRLSLTPGRRATRNPSTCDEEEPDNGDKNVETMRATNSVIQCNLIPPTPLKLLEKSSRMSSLACPPFDEGRDSTGESDGEGDDQFIKPAELRTRTCHFQLAKEFLPVKSERRCSAAAKYDVDDNLIKLVALHWNLSLNPNELLGKGSFGTVVAGQYQGQQVAVKVLKTTNPQRKASIIGEDNALNLPIHNHIARTMDIFQLGPDRALIIMEKMHKGNLFTLLNDPNYEMNCTKAINITKQIALALIFCHRQGVLHLDVKPQNVLVDSRNCCKLSDFGSSKKLTELEHTYKYSTLEGTVPYTAPEIFRRDRPTEKCDVYSFAITMWHILSRELPYEDENEHTVIYRVVSQNLRPGNNRKHVYSENADEKKLEVKYIELYEQGWHPDPAERPSMTEIHKNLIKIQFLPL